MGLPNTIEPADATGQLVVRAAARDFIKDIFRNLVPSWLRPHAPSQALKEILGCDLRTAERYFAGERAPDAVALVQLINSEIGVRLIEAAVADMPPAEALKFWDEMHRASLRALIRAHNNLTLIRHEIELRANDDAQPASTSLTTIR